MAVIARRTHAGSQCSAANVLATGAPAGAVSGSSKVDSAWAQGLGTARRGTGMEGRAAP